MSKSTKTAFAVVMVFALLPVASLAAGTDFEINVNSSDVEVDIENDFLLYRAPVRFGAGLLFSDQDYWIANIRMVVIDQVLAPPLSLGLGFRAAFGQEDRGATEHDLAALCFHFLGRYDFRKLGSSRLPISVGASYSIAPEVLSGGDAERYSEFKASLSFHINRSAAAIVGYRSEEIRFSEARANLDDDDVFFGFRLSF